MDAGISCGFGWPENAPPPILAMRSAILLAAADRAIEHKSRGSYQIAAKLLMEAHPLFVRCDRQEDFTSHLRALRARHKPKRALREELDRAGLP